MPGPRIDRLMRSDAIKDCRFYGKIATHSEILNKVERGEAVVMTAEEVSRLVESGDKSRLEEVDVVTTATRAVMSGTYAIFSFPVARPASFLRAKRVWINGISAQVGPCPNENLGVLDLVVFGTAHSRDRPNYGGGHLFRDLVEKKKDWSRSRRMMEDQFWPRSGWMICRMLASMDRAMPSRTTQPLSIRGREPVSTIFHARGFEPHCQGATFSGCGQINPLKNDPLLETIGIGTRILLNGAEGFVLGTGTRSTKERPNLSGFADMHQMSAEYMGGFATSAGPECICSWGVAVPVISDTILAEIARLDRDIALPVNDINTRMAIGEASYGDVWQGVDLAVEFDPERCQGCKQCRVMKACPMKAVSFDFEGPAPSGMSRCASIAAYASVNVQTELFNAIWVPSG